jgi:hypothetical protein
LQKCFINVTDFLICRKTLSICFVSVLSFRMEQRKIAQRHS